MSLSIDPEFRDLIPPLSKEERAGLESSLKEYGCHTPLITWNDTVIDGHNRFEICTKYGIEFDELEWPFADRRDATIWIIRNQFDRRNLSAPARMDLALRMKSEIQAQAQERQRAGGGDKKSGSVVEKLPQPIQQGTKTRDEVAALAGVSGRTLDKYEAVTKTATPELIQATRDGKVSVHTAAKATKLLTPAQQVEVLNTDTEKIGEAVRKEVAKAEARNQEIAEANAWVDEMNTTFRKPDFDPTKERRIVQIAAALYRALDEIMKLPAPAETLEAIRKNSEFRLDNLSAAQLWLAEFQKLYQEKKHEDLETVA